MSTFDALKLAKEHDLDLVEVGPTMDPPIAKIMDYGKYMYQKERQEKKSGAKVKKELERKTVRVGFKTGSHDLQIKAKKITEFLQAGHQVKIELTLRGREKGLSQMGREKLTQFLTTLPEPYEVREPIGRSPFGWTIIVIKAK